MKTSFGKTIGKSVVALTLSLSALLAACGGGGMDNAYHAANGTAVYRVSWEGDSGRLYDMDGNYKGTIYADDMRDLDYYGDSVNGHYLDGWMYYDKYANRLYLEDSSGGVGRSINSKTAGSSSDSNWAAQASEARREKVNMVARGLNETYALPMERAKVIASALQSFHETQVDRGASTEQDVASTFKTVFGVEYNSALAAAKAFQGGSAQPIRDLTNRSADYLGIKPAQAQRFVKDMYRKTLKEQGYDVGTVAW
jgi:hypothetical protein